MNLHKEINFEIEICEHLAAHGWLHAADTAASNPVNQRGGHRTSYLWEQVWERHSWLETLGRYVVA